MPAIAAAYPILPGKLDAWKHFMSEMAGPRQAEHEAFLRRLNATVARTWHQTTPQGDLVLVYREGDDLAQGFQQLAASQEPFDVWFKQQVLDIHGVDFNQPLPGPPPELFLDWEAR